MNNKEIEKKEKKKKYLRDYYEKNKKLWRDGEKYHKTYKKIEPLKITRGKVLVTFDWKNYNNIYKMPTHKIANSFIKKYNKDLQIKGYSALPINQKLRMIEDKLNSLKLDNIYDLKTEWNNTTKNYKKKITSNEKKREQQKKGDIEKKDTKKKVSLQYDTRKPEKKQKDITSFFKPKITPKKGQTKITDDFKKKPINRSSLNIVPVKKLEKEIKEEKQKEGDNEKKDTKSKRVSVNRRERNSLERDFKRTYNKTLYRALEIPNKSNPSPDELKKLCRKLQLKNHPDKGGTKERIQEINDACKILESTIKKK